MSWKVVDRMTLYRDSVFSTLAPNITRSPSGDLLLFFLRAPFHGYPHHNHPLFRVISRRSSDDGQSWSEDALVTANPYGGAMDFAVRSLPDGSMLLASGGVELHPADALSDTAQPHGRQWVSRYGKPFWTRSVDDGYTWSSPVRFPPVPDAVWGYPAQHSGVCRSGILILPDGRLLLPGKATDTTSEFRYFGTLRVSNDNGETWEYGGRICEDPVAHFSEPTIHRTPNGRIIVLYRCHPGTLGPEIVRRQGFRGSMITDSQFESRLLVIVTSDDDGRTWSPWQPTKIHGSPGHMLGLRDGRIFLTVGTRWAGQRGCIARVVEPEGGDLDSAEQLIIQADAASPDCGYPWSVELQDGRVLVVYWHHYDNNDRGVEGAVVEEV